MSKPKDKPKRKLFVPCGKCIDGLVRINRPDGNTAMRYCNCFLSWKYEISEAPPVVVLKSRAVKD